MKVLIGSLMILINVSCSLKSIVRLYSLDKSNCVSIITEKKIRYVIAGKNETLPDTNYIKLDISDITELDNEVYICWLKNKGWDMVVDKSKILENRLDTDKYKFNNQLPTDTTGIPTPIKYSKENCAVFDYYEMKLIPNQGAIVEIK